MRIFLIFLTLIISPALCQSVELTILTSKGYVSYEAGDNWAVLGAQTKMPLASMAFQIHDPADEGTSDSTNISVSLYDLQTPKGQKAMEVTGRPYGEIQPIVSQVGDWKVIEQMAKQNGTTYTILDAVRGIADVAISVRIAWPELKGHPTNYSKEMRATFFKLLHSVNGGLGEFTAKPGAVIRRPIQ